MPCEEDLLRIRMRFEHALDSLLTQKPSYVDNSDPSKGGYSLGFHLAFHGLANIDLKHKLSKVYLNFCPALRFV